MAKDFQDFVDAYMGDHVRELMFDAVRDLEGGEAPFPLTSESAEFIASTAFRVSLSLLRQYHAWISQQY